MDWEVRREVKVQPGCEINKFKKLYRAALVLLRKRRKKGTVDVKGLKGSERKIGAKGKSSTG